MGFGLSSCLSQANGKIAVITGGTTGIGLAIAQQYVAEGAFVFITGRRQAELDAAVRLIGKNVEGVQGDVSNMADLDKLFATVTEKKGHIDILVANAGWGQLAPLGTITEELYDKTFAINVKGLLFTVQKGLPLLRDGASIILISSIASIKGFPGFSIYTATKAAVRNFARSWILELKDRKIRVNVISPGPIDTPLLHSVDEPLQLKASAQATIPLGRIGTPYEVARPAVFLASDDSSFINGVEFFVDGGLAQI